MNSWAGCTLYQRKVVIQADGCHKGDHGLEEELGASPQAFAVQPFPVIHSAQQREEHQDAERQEHRPPGTLKAQERGGVHQDRDKHNRQDDHQSTHGRRTRFGYVPLRSLHADSFADIQVPEHSQQGRPPDERDHEADARQG
jgi:hypothetical protein